MVYTGGYNTTLEADGASTVVVGSPGFSQACLFHVRVPWGGLVLTASAAGMVGQAPLPVLNETQVRRVEAVYSGGELLVSAYITYKGINIGAEGETVDFIVANTRASATTVNGWVNTTIPVTISRSVTLEVEPAHGSPYYVTVEYLPYSSSYPGFTAPLPPNLVPGAGVPGLAPRAPSPNTPAGVVTYLLLMSLYIMLAESIGWQLALVVFGLIVTLYGALTGGYALALVGGALAMAGGFLLAKLTR